MFDSKIVQVTIPDNLISFRMGQPSFSLLPTETLRNASRLFNKTDNTSYLQYGCVQGSKIFRENLSAFLTKNYNAEIKSNDLFITSGATSAIDLLCTLLTKTGDTVFVEDPTYFIISRILKNHHLNIISIPTDENGMVLSELEEKLRKYKPAFIYTIPTYQNPSSITLSEERRVKLAELCYKYNSYIIADEVYHLLGYEEPYPEPLCNFDVYEKVISVGSFTKILAPGLHLGWIHTLNREIMDLLKHSGMVFSGGGMNPYMSGLVEHVVKSGDLGKHLTFVKSTLEERLLLLDEKLSKYLSDYVEYRKPKGGFYIWAKLKNALSAIKFADAAEKNNVAILPGNNCSVVGNFKDYMRLSVSYLEKEQITEGVERLRKTFGLL